MRCNVCFQDKQNECFSPTQIKKRSNKCRDCIVSCEKKRARQVPGRAWKKKIGISDHAIHRIEQRGIDIQLVITIVEQCSSYIRQQNERVRFTGEGIIVVYFPKYKQVITAWKSK